jgi:peroxiredoxin
MMSVPLIGETAPDFKLAEASERMMRLSDEVKRGPVIVVFYPTDWGMICTMMMKRFMDMLGELKRIGVSIVAISVNTTTSHRSWKMHLDIEFPLLSDVDGAAVRRYGLMLGESEFLRGRSARAVFIVDRDMKVRYAWKGPNQAVHPEYEEILAAAKRLHEETTV